MFGRLFCIRICVCACVHMCVCGREIRRLMLVLIFSPFVVMDLYIITERAFNLTN